MTSLIVITLEIGQSAGKAPVSSFGDGYGAPSTTARVSVHNDGLTNRSGLKIQSIHVGKPHGQKESLPVNSLIIKHLRA